MSMPSNTPSSSPVPPLASPVTPAPLKRRSWILIGCGGLLLLVLVLVATVFITLWWIQRPIKPVVLTAPEKAAVDQKLRQITLEEPLPAPPPARTSTSNQVAQPVELPPVVVPPEATPDRPYEPGSKVLRLTEREVNGLLNANTDLGKSVRLEFARDAIHAYLAIPIPEDFPIGGGRMFRARGRFRVSVGNGGAPFAILEDITVFGLSLPKAWLGGLKGENLLAEAVGNGSGKQVLKGIKALKVEPGALVIEVED